MHLRKTLRKMAVTTAAGQIIGHTWELRSGGFRGKRIGGYTQPHKSLDRSDAVRWVVLSHRDAVEALS